MLLLGKGFSAHDLKDLLVNEVFVNGATALEKAHQVIHPKGMIVEVFNML